MALQIFGENTGNVSGINYVRVGNDGQLYFEGVDSGARVLITNIDNDITYLSGQINSLSGISQTDLDYLSGVIDYVSGQVVVDFSKYDSVYSTVNSNSAIWQVSANYDAEVDYLSGEIDDLTETDTYLSGAIDSNTTNITNNDLDISYLSGSIDDLTASDILSERIAGSTFSTVQHMQDIFHSAGVTGGGSITDDGDGTVTVLSGTGLIRATDDNTAPLKWFDWVGESGANVALTDQTMNYLYVEYNSGSPQVVATTLERTNYDTNVFLGTVYRDGTELHITEGTRAVVGDHALQMILRMQATNPFQREDGGILGETGTRNIVVTAGTWWEGLTQFSTAAIDTSATDTFKAYYRNGSGGWSEQLAQTQIDNQFWDDGTGTLNTLTANRYGVHWVFIDTDGDIFVVYGRGDYLISGAEDATVPSDLPPEFSESHARIIGKIIIQEGDSSFTSVESVFERDFASSQPTDHGQLLGLSDDDHNQYSLVNGTRGYTGTVSGVTPTLDSHLSTKGYVDSQDALGDSAYATVNSNSAVWELSANYDAEIDYLSGAIDNNSTNITNNDADIAYLSGQIDASGSGVSVTSSVQTGTGYLGTTFGNVGVGFQVTVPSDGDYIIIATYIVECGPLGSGSSNYIMCRFHDGTSQVGAEYSVSKLQRTATNSESHDSASLITNATLTGGDTISLQGMRSANNALIYYNTSGPYGVGQMMLIKVS